MDNVQDKTANTKEMLNSLWCKSGYLKEKMV